VLWNWSESKKLCNFVKAEVQFDQFEFLRAPAKICINLNPTQVQFKLLNRYFQIMLSLTHLDLTILQEFILILQDLQSLVKE
jgi:hypothetical protein